MLSSNSLQKEMSYKTRRRSLSLRAAIARQISSSSNTSTNTFKRRIFQSLTQSLLMGVD